MPEQPPVRLEGKDRGRHVIDAGDQGRDMMRNNNHNNRRKADTGAADQTIRAAPPGYAAEHRETVRRGLRVLAKIIARVHLRRQAARTNTAAPGPPQVSEHGEQAIPETGGQN